MCFFTRTVFQICKFFGSERWFFHQMSYFWSLNPIQNGHFNLRVLHLLFSRQPNWDRHFCLGSANLYGSKNSPFQHEQLSITNTSTIIATLSVNSPDVFEIRLKIPQCNPEGGVATGRTPDTRIIRLVFPWTWVPRGSTVLTLKHDDIYIVYGGIW